MHSFWEEAEVAPAVLDVWFQSEAAGREEKKAPTSDALLDRLLDHDDPLSAEVRTLAAGIGLAAASSPPSVLFVQRLDRIQRFLEKHDRLLSVRGCWLAWLALTRLAHGDVLALARARDRLLERLYQLGLSSDLDMPRFLRTSGQRAGERFHSVRDRFAHLRELARKWVPADSESGARTHAYVDLIFAFGHARLGELTEARKLLAVAAESLKDKKKDPVHAFLFDAYFYRIEQVLEGKGHAGSLPTPLLEALEKMEKFERYKIERLRSKSQILEPHDKVDPYRPWQGHLPDELLRELAALPDITDRGVLLTRLSRLLTIEPKKKETPVPVLKAALELRRLGEAFANEVLAHIPSAVDQLTARLKVAAKPTDRPPLIEQTANLLELASSSRPTTVSRNWCKTWWTASSSSCACSASKTCRRASNGWRGSVSAACVSSACAT